MNYVDIFRQNIVLILDISAVAVTVFSESHSRTHSTCVFSRTRGQAAVVWPETPEALFLQTHP